MRHLTQEPKEQRKLNPVQRRSNKPSEGSRCGDVSGIETVPDASTIRTRLQANDIIY